MIRSSLVVVGVGVLLLCVKVSSSGTTELEEVNGIASRYSLKRVEDIFFQQKTEYRKVLSIRSDEDVVFGYLGEEIDLRCQYTLCPDSDAIITVTWKFGDRLKLAKRIAQYTLRHMNDHITTEDYKIFNEKYAKRLLVHRNGKLNLKIKPLLTSDEGNYWCQIQSKGNFEYGTDTTAISVILNKSWLDNLNYPKVSAPLALTSAIAGDTVRLTCRCKGINCVDLTWFKGPYNEWGNEFESIYSRTTSSEYRMQTKEQIAEELRARISVEGFQLTIRDVKVSDAGRYWCEAKGFKDHNPVNRRWNIKSVVLTVGEVAKHSCQ